jgi:DNA-binding transcriptional regulator GbsR (MarR family)
MKSYELNDNEREFIDIWGRLFKSRGQSKTLGRIWGILNLIADSPENGLNQDEILYYVGSSLATVSRHLKTLIDMQIINYTKEKVRKYYTSKNFKHITNLRFQASINEYIWTITKLNEIKNEIPTEKLSIHENLIQTIEVIENVLTKISEIYKNVMIE